MSYRVVAFFVFQIESEQICSVKNQFEHKSSHFEKKLIGLDYQKGGNR